MATPHIQAEMGDFAEACLLPGDPLRARLIAETYLENAKEVTSVRNILGYTGSYKGKPVSVLASGMGCASMGIYSYELIHFFGVKKLIRVGSCGSYQPDVKLYDLVLAQGVSTDSNYGAQFDLPGHYAPLADFELLSKAKAYADAKGWPAHVGNVFCSDVFYGKDRNRWRKWAELGVLAVEMESNALYLNASAAGVQALALFTVSDSLVTGEATSAEERQNAFTQMMELALNII